MSTLSRVACLTWIFGLLAAVHAVVNQKTWTYDLISVVTTSSNEDMIKLDLRIDRISRGVFALSGPVLVNFDVNDDTTVEAHSYRSATGSADYKLLPFAVNKMHIYKCFNSFYRDMVMKSFADCSDLPQFEKEIEPPLEKKVYTLNKCQISTDGMPQHLQEGYYKVLLAGHGDVEWSVEVVAKVEAKLQ